MNGTGGPMHSRPTSSAQQMTDSHRLAGDIGLSLGKASLFTPKW